MGTENSKMAELLAEADAKLKPLAVGDMVEGRIVYLGKDNCLLDLGEFGTGIVRGKELDESYNTLSDLLEQPVSAIVTDLEDDQGYINLSLRRASRERIWEDLEQLRKNNEIIELKPQDANRGGLLIEYEGIKGFLPVSQLSAENYPRVEGGDKEEIFSRLKSLVGQALKVTVLDLDRRETKLIFSEKDAMKEKTLQAISNLKVGSKVKGQVTGVVDFGIFMNVEGVEGLVHISEIDWNRVLSPKDFAEVGQEIEAQVLSIDGDKVSLSLKRLKEDPWLEDIKKYNEGDTVKGSIIRVTPFGVFVDLGNMEALAHVSELKEEDETIKIDELFSVGDQHEFTVLTIEPDTRKIFLTKKEQKAKAKKPAAKKKAVSKKKDKK